MPFAECQGARLYYEIHGAGEDLLLIPGFGSTIPVYWANIPPLSKHFRVIAFDPRGAGRSDVPADGYTMRVFADDAASVLDAAGARRAHVFGTSFGGMVAQHLALEHPERVRGLVLGCTTAGGDRHVLPPADNIVRFLAAAEIADAAEAVRSTYFMHYSDAYTAAHDAEIVERSLANAALRSSAVGRLGQLVAVQGHDTHDRLAEIKSPTLVAHGGDDGMVPVENGRMLAAAIPGARLIIYPEARHIFFAECAAALNSEIVSFLQRGSH
ncbi:MAG: alpha/beta hydrolase [Chloroflexota bacterium]|nr:alpha/beta hydrolase [Chloroflexota bacterium]